MCLMEHFTSNASNSNHVLNHHYILAINVCVYDRHTTQQGHDLVFSIKRFIAEIPVIKPFPVGSVQ